MSRKFIMSMEEESIDTDTSLDTQAVMVDPNTAPVEDPVPQVGNLEVDKVFEEENDPTKEDQIVSDLVDENETRVDAVEEAVEATTELVAVVEALKQDSSPALIKLAMLSLESTQRRLQFKSKVGVEVSLESFKSDKAVTAKVAMESIAEVIRQIWEKICKVIKATIAMIKEFISNLIPGVRKDIKFLKEQTELVINQRSADEKNKLYKLDPSKLNAIELSRYITPGVTNAGLGTMLTINGKQPADYNQEMINILSLFNINKVNDLFNKYFVSSVKDFVFNEIIKDLPTAEVIIFKPETLIADCLPAVLASVPSKTFKEKVAKDNQLFYVTQPRLGGYVLIHEFNQCYESGGNSGSNLNTLKDIANWDITQYSAGAQKQNDGWFRYLPTDEIISTSKEANLILNVLLEIERNVEDFVTLQATMESISKEAGGFSFDTSDDKSIVKLDLLRTVVAAMAKINSVITTITVTNAKYAKGTCNAWALYLKDTYIKEKTLASAN